MKWLGVLVRSCCVATIFVALQAWGQAGPVRTPIQSSLKAQKVVSQPGGAETLEDTESVAVGDLIQYTAQHLNVSPRRLLLVDFSIPVPEGTRYIDGSAQPVQGVLVREPGGKRLLRWRVPALQPGEAVVLSMRVRVEPDPSLRPVLPSKPRPELRMQP